jgi:hypothetical protein
VSKGISKKKIKKVCGPEEIFFLLIYKAASRARAMIGQEWTVSHV